MTFLDYFKVVTSTQVLHGERIINLFEARQKQGIGPTKVYNELQDLGIGYRKTDMLNDYRRYGAVMRIKDRTPEKLSKVFNYYDKVFEPFRKANKMNTKQAWAAIHEWKKGEFETIERAKQIKEWNIEFKFCRTPPCEGDIDEQDKV